MGRPAPEQRDLWRAVTHHPFPAGATVASRALLVVAAWCASEPLADALLGGAYTSLHRGSPRDTPHCLRLWYGRCAIAAALLQLSRGDAVGAMRTVDTALCLCPGEGDADGAPPLHVLAGTVEAALQQDLGGGVRGDVLGVGGAPPPPPQWAGEGCPVPRLPTHEVPLPRFYAQFLGTTPLILTGGMNHWPALTRWGDFPSLARRVGHRWVPVEVGGRYTSPGWRIEMRPLAEVLRLMAVGGEGGGAPPYLAQHDLFAQISGLRGDVVIPDYALPEGDAPPSLRVWVGPAGTHTNLHYDPGHGLLCQVVGWKAVRLYPAASPRDAMYPHPPPLDNTSAVNPGSWDAATHPLFGGVAGTESWALLGPGDMLYTPPRWWHEVVALTASASVSVWW